MMVFFMKTTGGFVWFIDLIVYSRPSLISELLKTRRGGLFFLKPLLVIPDSFYIIVRQKPPS